MFKKNVLYFLIITLLLFNLFSLNVAAIDSGDLDGYDEEVVETMAVNKSFDSFESKAYFN